MGKFVKAVQTDAVTGPLRRKFTIKTWMAASEELGEDEADKSLTEAALLISSKADRIRAAQTLTFSKQFNATSKVRAFVALANCELCTVQRKTQEAMEALAQGNAEGGSKNPLFADQLLGVKMPTPSGADFSPDEIIQSVVDGLQMPLRCILESSPRPEGRPNLSDIDWNTVQLDANLSLTYIHLESIWDECLWNDYRVVKSEDTAVFFPNTRLWPKVEVVSRYRQNRLKNEAMVRSNHLQKGMLHMGLTNPRERLRVKSISRNGKRDEIAMGWFEREDERYRNLLTMRAIASELYYVDLLDSPREVLRGASLNDLLSAWTVVQGVVELLCNEVKDSWIANPNEPKTWIPRYCTVVQIEALVRALVLASGRTYQQANALVEFLIFRGYEGQELWAQPLVPVSATGIAPLFAATQYPNLNRVIDVWLKQLGEEMSIRGSYFENHVRDAVTESIAESPLLGKSKVVDRSFTFYPPVGREEEVDLLFAVGNTLIVGEVKCFREPTEAKEMARHRDKVVGAVAQVKRKAQAIEQHKNAFREQAGFDMAADFSVKPVVVLNNAFGVGFSQEGVAVVDLYILERYFDGKLVNVASQDAVRGFAPLKATSFYESAEGAEKNISLYLDSPPQVGDLRGSTKLRWIPIPSVHDRDWSGVLVTFSCELDYGKLLSQNFPEAASAS